MTMYEVEHTSIDYEKESRMELLRQGILHKIDELSHSLHRIDPESLVAGHVLPCHSSIAWATDNIRSKYDRLKVMIVRRLKSGSGVWEIVKITPKHNKAPYSRLRSCDSSEVPRKYRADIGHF